MSICDKIHKERKRSYILYLQLLVVKGMTKFNFCCYVLYEWEEVAVRLAHSCVACLTVILEVPVGALKRVFSGQNYDESRISLCQFQTKKCCLFVVTLFDTWQPKITCKGIIVKHLTIWTFKCNCNHVQNTQESIELLLIMLN